MSKSTRLAKKVIHFTIQFRSKSLTHFYEPQLTRTSTHSNLNSLEPQLTRHYQKDTAATQPKTLPTLQFFQQKCSWLFVRKKTFALHISRLQRTALSKHLESKCLYIPVNLCKRIFCSRQVGSFYLVEG